MPQLSRRRLLAASVPALGGAAAALHGASRTAPVGARGATPRARRHAGTTRRDRGPRRPRGLPRRRTVDHAANGFDPHEILRDFDWGTTTRHGERAASCASGSWSRSTRRSRSRPASRFAAWTYNGRIPGPTLRCREGERLRITFVNGSAHPHTIHFHGIHPAEMDGVPGPRRRRDPARRPDGLRVRRAARRAAPLPLPRPPARRAHRQGPLRRVHRRPRGRPRGRRRDRDGHERVRHELRPRERGLRRQHDRLRLHGPADRRARATSWSASTSSTSSSTT